MLEEKLSDLILVVESHLKLVKIKIKKNKKELKELENELKNNKYIDNEKVSDNKERLINQTSELDIMLYKLNKVHYRLKVCDNMLEDKIYKALDECSHTLNLIKIKTKNKKKEYRQIEKILKNINYVDEERVQADKSKILEELAKLKVEEYKLKKIFYRLNVCLTILNSEIE